MSADREKDIEAILADPTLITRALRKAVRAAVNSHWKAGRRVAVWRNDKVTWVGPPRKPKRRAPRQ